MTPPDALARARRILVVRLDNLGDVLLTAPFARALSAAAPEARLTLLASPGGALGAPLLPWYRRVVTARALWQDLDARLPFEPGRELALIETLRAGAYDAAFVLTSFSQTAWPAAYAAYLAGIPVRAGFASDFGGGVLTDPVAPPPDGTHQAERNLALLAALGIPVADADPAVVVPASAARQAATWLGAAGIEDGRFVAIVPGASCAARRYDPRRYAIVARGLAAAGRRVVVLGTGREAALAAPILDACPSALSLVGQTSVEQFAAIIERAGLVVCGNSAALHLADAFGRPLVVLYSGTDLESEWAARRAPATVLRVATACSPCRGFECPYAMACLDVDPGTVVAAALARLAAPPGREEPCVASAS